MCLVALEETSVLGLDSYYNLELSKLYDIFYSVLHKTVESEDEQQVRQVTVEKDGIQLRGYDCILSESCKAW